MKSILVLSFPFCVFRVTSFFTITFNTYIRLSMSLCLLSIYLLFLDFELTTYVYIYEYGLYNRYIWMCIYSFNTNKNVIFASFFSLFFFPVVFFCCKFPSYIGMNMYVYIYIYIDL